MVLNHINLAVSAVQAACGFLMKHFGLDPQGMPGNDRIAFLREMSGTGGVSARI
jgi:lactoylglutathione lyase